MRTVMHASLALALTAAAAGAASAQQSALSPASATPTLQFVNASQLPAGTSMVGSDASGNLIEQTQDASVLQDVPYHFSFNYNGLLGPGYSAPTPQFNVTDPGSLQLATSARDQVAHVPNVDDHTAGLNALADNSDSGCTIALCLASPVSVPQCQPALDLLGARIRNGGGRPSCRGTSIDYIPYACKGPWTLVQLDPNGFGSGNYACRALVAAAAPPPPQCGYGFDGNLICWDPLTGQPVADSTYQSSSGDGGGVGGGATGGASGSGSASGDAGGGASGDGGE